MKPATIDAGDGGLSLPIADAAEDIDSLLEDYCIPGSTADKALLAAWNGHKFEVLEGEAESTRSVNFSNYTHEYKHFVYYPIDRRTTAKDWAGAIAAKHNEDGTAWLPDWDKDYHIDHEFRLQAAVTTAFERQMHTLHKTLRTANYSALLSSTSESRDAFGAASRAYDNLGNFREDVKAQVLKEARKLHIGYYHQNPHEAHVHDPIERAILEVAANWAAHKDVTVWTPIAAAVGFVLAAVQKEHPYEDRWIREVEAPKRGEDPVAGYEYCYTAVTSKHVIEGHDNLPDPNWDFDHLRNGQVLRGNYTYRDDEPKASAFLFVAVRFKRPIPEGTRPGQDIGRVEWTQDPAYLIPAR